MPVDVWNAPAGMPLVNALVLNAGAPQREEKAVEQDSLEPFLLKHLAIGDLCETITDVKLYNQPAGQVVKTLENGTVLEVCELGGQKQQGSGGNEDSGQKLNFLMKVRPWLEDYDQREAEDTGWISLRREGGIPNVVLRRADISFRLWDFVPSGQPASGRPASGSYCSTGRMMVREEESLNSKELAMLPPHTTVTIEEISGKNLRRARISSDALNGPGWVSVCTRTGELLLEPASERRLRPGIDGSCKSRVESLLKAAHNIDGFQALRTALAEKPERSRPNPNANDTRGRTALMLAAASGNTQAVEELLKHRDRGLDVTWADGTLKTALHHAAMHNPQGEPRQAAIVDLLLNSQESLSVDGQHVTQEMVQNRDSHDLAMRKLLEAVDVDGHTALQLAARAGSVEVAKALIANRANVNVNHKRTKRPLDHARSAGHKELIKLLEKDGGASGASDMPASGASAPASCKDQEAATKCSKDRIWSTGAPEVGTVEPVVQSDRAPVRSAEQAAAIVDVMPVQAARLAEEAMSAQLTVEQEPVLLKSPSLVQEGVPTNLGLSHEGELDPPNPQEGALAHKEPEEAARPMDSTLSKLEVTKPPAKSKSSKGMPSSPRPGKKTSNSRVDTTELAPEAGKDAGKIPAPNSKKPKSNAKKVKNK